MFCTFETLTDKNPGGCGKHYVHEDGDNALNGGGGFSTIQIPKTKIPDLEAASSFMQNSTGGKYKWNTKFDGGFGGGGHCFQGVGGGGGFTGGNGGSLYGGGGGSYNLKEW